MCVRGSSPGTGRGRRVAVTNQVRTDSMAHLWCALVQLTVLRLLRFSEAAGARDEFDAVERARAVDIPFLLQVIERARLVACLGAVRPLGVAVVDHLSRCIALRNHDG